VVIKFAIACRVLFLLLFPIEGKALCSKFPATRKCTEFLQMTYTSDGHESLLHSHPSDSTCHWSPILKPLAFTVMKNKQLAKALVDSHSCKGSHMNTDGRAYTKWLVRVGENGYLNLINLFLFMIELRGFPSRADITARNI
jgi:hypothetical protein